jgi:cell pole-organizing protein PopZ
MNETPPRNEAAMADILASIRRIVAEEDRRAPQLAQAGLDALADGIFELTTDMRIDGDRDNGLALEPPEPSTPTVDEAAVADIARTVLREELNGPMGVALTQNIRKLVREEIARALADRR